MRKICALLQAVLLVACTMVSAVAFADAPNASHVHDTAGSDDVTVGEAHLVKQSPEGDTIWAGNLVSYTVEFTLTPTVQGEYYKGARVYFKIKQPEDTAFYNEIDCPLGTSTVDNRDFPETKTCYHDYRFTNEGFAAPGTFTQTFVVKTGSNGIDYYHQYGGLYHYVLQPTIQVSTRNDEATGITVETSAYRFAGLKPLVDNVSQTAQGKIAFQEVAGNRQNVASFTLGVEADFTKFYARNNTSKAYSKASAYIDVQGTQVPVDASFLSGKPSNTWNTLSTSILNGNTWTFGNNIRKTYNYGTTEGFYGTLNVASINSDGVSLWEYYHIPAGQPITISVDAYDYGFSNSDLGIAYVDDNSNQSIRDDDKASAHVTLVPFTADSDTSHVRHSFYRYDNYSFYFPKNTSILAVVQYVYFDARTYYDKTHFSSGYRFLVKPDGSNWTSSEEASRTRLEQMRAYDSYDEAKQHGLIVGLANSKPLNFFAAEYSYDYLDSKMYERQMDMEDQLRKTHRVGYDYLIPSTPTSYSYWIVGKTRAYTISDMKQYAHLPDTTSERAWFQWASQQDWYTISTTSNITPTYSLGEQPEDVFTAPTYGEYCKILTPEHKQGTIAATSFCTRRDPYYLLVTRHPTPQTVYVDERGRTVTWNFGFDGSRTYEANSSSYVDPGVTAPLPTTIKLGRYQTLIPHTLQFSTDGTHWTTIEPVSIAPPPTEYNSPVITIPQLYLTHDNYRQARLRFQTSVGTPTNPTTDVKTGNILTVTFIGNHVRESYNNYEYATVVRTTATGLATVNKQTEAEPNTPIESTHLLYNNSGQYNQDAYGVSVLPVASHGTQTLSDLWVEGADTSLDGLTFYVTSQKINPDTAKTISLNQIRSWQQVNPEWRDGKPYLPAGHENSTAYAVYLPSMNQNSYLQIHQTITPAGNQVGDNTINTWADGHNQVLANTTIVAITISGHVWRDMDKNGVRGKSEDGFAGATVTLHDKNGRQLASTTTDNTGAYKFMGFMHGEYRVRVKRSPDSVPAGEASTYAWQDNTGQDESSVINAQVGAVYENADFGYPIARRMLTGLPASGKPVVMIVVTITAITLIGVGLLVAARRRGA